MHFELCHVPATWNPTVRGNRLRGSRDWGINLARISPRRAGVTILVVWALLGTLLGQRNLTEPAPQGRPKEAVLFLGVFHSQDDVEDNRTACQHVRDFFRSSSVADGHSEPTGTCDRVFDLLAGPADPREPGAPMSPNKVSTDSKHRVLVTDSDQRAVHIFDFVRRKYLQIGGKPEGQLRLPWGVAVDAGDNIYITDVQAGRILVYNAKGRFQRYIGDYKGETLFEHPTGIAIDSRAGHIYVADGSREKLFLLNCNGKVLARIGGRTGGSGPAEFKHPTDVALGGGELFVLDEGNSRVQILDLQGRYRGEFHLRNAKGASMAADARGNVLIAGFDDAIQILDRMGRLQSRFGGTGEREGAFHGPMGIAVDAGQRAYITDVGNHRVQVFQIIGTTAPKPTANATP
jgi:hypothetical protein